MRQNVILRLLISGILLLVVYVGVARDGEKLFTVLEFFPSKFWLAFSMAPSQSIIGTTFLGYLFSFTTTLKQPSTRFRLMRPISLALAGLGLASEANELLRFFLNYNFRFIVHLPLLLVVVDWASFFLRRNVNSPTKSVPVES